jgi:hypothetical protein
MITSVLLTASFGLGALPGPEALTPAQFQPAAASVVGYPDNRTLIRYSGQRLSEVAQVAWVDFFAKNSYFSAFAYAKDGGYGFATTANSPEAARDIALRQCASLNDQCRVIAEIHPVGYKPPAPGEVTLSVEVAGYYREAFALEAFRAMAVSLDGSYSTAWGYPTQAEAEARALADCESFRIDSVDLRYNEAADWPCFLLPGLD